LKILGDMEFDETWPIASLYTLLKGKTNSK
jgi:hypothetical protein